MLNIDRGGIVVIFLRAVVAGSRIPVVQPLPVAGGINLGRIEDAGIGEIIINPESDGPRNSITRSDIGNEGVEPGNAIDI